MTFIHGQEEKFLEIFSENKLVIRNFKGCSHLELFRDIHNPNIFTTLSHWENDNYLNDYRNSDLFSQVWAKTKLLFGGHPQANSYIIQE